MAIHFDAQEENEVRQIRARELQLENTEKLNNITSVVENINLDQIESNTSEIKNIVVQNLEDQPNLQDVIDEMNKVSKSLSSLKGQITKLSKKIEEVADIANNEETKDG